VETVRNLSGIYGYTFTFSESGSQGLELAQREKPSLVMVEMHLPDMQGIDFIIKLRDLNIEIPVIFVAEKLDSAQLAEAMRYSLSEFIIKPVQDSEFEKKVRLHVGGSSEPVAPLPGAEETPPNDFKMGLVHDGERIPVAFRDNLPPDTSLLVYSSLENFGLIEQIQRDELEIVILDCEQINIETNDIILKSKGLFRKALLYGLFSHKEKYASIKARYYGLDGFLYRPFQSKQIARAIENASTHILEHVFADAAFIQVEQYRSEEEELEDYYSAVRSLVDSALHDLAANCFEEAVLDLRAIPSAQENVTFFQELTELCDKICLQLKVVPPSTETPGIQILESADAVQYVNSLESLWS